MLKISFDDPEWTASTALINIFFSDLEVDWKNKGAVSALGALVQSALLSRRYDANEPPPQQEKFVWSVIRGLKKEFPDMRIDWTATPLIWLRFSFQALAHGISPSTNYLRSYSKWRFERARTKGLETVRQTTGDAKNGENPKSFRIGDHTFVGHTLDTFLLNKKIKVDPGSGTKWELCSVSGLNSTQESASLNTPAKKSSTPATKQPRGIRRTVGEKAYAIIEQCVEDAKQSQFPGWRFSARKIDGRYKSSLSRPEFIAKLLKHYKGELPYAESTIRRAITDFVAFPNYRRNWADSRKDPTDADPA